VYKIYIANKAKRELKKISQSHQEAIISALKDIGEDPLSGKPLTRELSGKFSYRVGVYRIIYTINQQDKIIQIITAGHRSTIYN
jgi:mRNA interferase RelE/StbE